jgi:hypothetical protein
VIGYDTLLDEENRKGVHVVTCEIKRHGSKMNGHHVGYWIEFADTRALLGRDG